MEYFIFPKIQMLKPDYPLPMMATSGDEGGKMNEVSRAELVSVWEKT